MNKFIITNNNNRFIIINSKIIGSIVKLGFRVNESIPQVWG